MTKSQSKPKQHPIRYIAEKTGVKPITLRAWENRYKLLVPKRTEKGHRYYSDEDVQLVQRVVALLNQGYSISKAVEAVQNYNDYELVGEGERRHLINFEPIDKMIFQGNIDRAVHEINELYALYSPEAFAQVILPSIMSHLDQEVWPEIEQAELYREMLIDGILLRLQTTIHEKNNHKDQKKVLVVGYRTGMVKSLALHGLLIANILHVHGFKTAFCSGVSSLPTLKELVGFDRVVIFARSDDFHIHQLDKMFKDSNQKVAISVVGKSIDTKYIKCLPQRYDEIFAELGD